MLRRGSIWDVNNPIQKCYIALALPKALLARACTYLARPAFLVSVVLILIHKIQSCDKIHPRIVQVAWRCGATIRPVRQKDASGGVPSVTRFPRARAGPRTHAYLSLAAAVFLSVVTGCAYLPTAPALLPPVQQPIGVATGHHHRAIALAATAGNGGRERGVMLPVPSKGPSEATAPSLPPAIVPCLLPQLP